MGFLGRWRRKNASTTTAPEEGRCPHVTLVPRWDNAADMGHEDRVSSLRCDACGASFTPAEARELRRTEASRLTKT